MDSGVISGPTWPAVVLALINAAQLLGLGWLAWQQTLSSRERARRAEADEEAATGAVRRGRRPEG